MICGFHLHTQFGKGFTHVLWYEHGVVAKTFGTALFGSYFATYHALKHVLFAILYQSYGCAELCRAVVGI